MDHTDLLATELDVRTHQVRAAVALLDEGNTIPFIARYRKEVTGGLDEDQLRRLSDSISRLRSLEERRQVVLRSIQEQGLLTQELEMELLSADSHTVLEDIYRPYKPKRRTRASTARERGLQPLADLILEQAHLPISLGKVVAKYLSQDVPTAKDALSGARDIVAETISDNADVRREVRAKALQWGVLRSEKATGAQDEKQTYELYYDFEQRIPRLQPHQVLAINRGEAENVLRVQVEVPERDWRSAIFSALPLDRRSPLAAQLEAAANDAAARLLLPSIERDVRNTLRENAEKHAIGVFASNLRSLLGQPPLAGRIILGIDPGYRTGCKFAVVDPTGKVLDTGTIYPHAPQNQWKDALKTLEGMVRRFGASLIAIGNGTASRETEKLAAELISLVKPTSLAYLIVNEAGASVYSASPLARVELPNMDVSMRGAVSIARRVQDPLAELVKIDPRSIGVGMYQHDVDQRKLQEALDAVVESVVNQVGVELNSASPSLLAYVAGIGAKLAERIVAHRNEHGPFGTRATLLGVQGLGPKTYEQAAGFLRIRDGVESLDATAIHPESYPAARKVLRIAGIDAEAGLDERQRVLDTLAKTIPVDDLSAQVGVGVPTLKDILEQLARPGRDPREDLPPPILRTDVLSMEDLVPGMVLSGTVRNVVDFGAFVDIGVKQDGLLHRSQIPRGEHLKAGQVIQVEILNVDPDRGRISLGWV